MLDDSILDEIQCSDDPRLEKAQSIIERIQFRQHYRCVGEKGIDQERANLKWKEITVKAIFEHAQFDDDSEDNLKIEDIGLKKFVITHGLKEKHPLYHVKFFDKRSISNSSYRLPQRKLESMVPKYNQSWTVRLFVKSMEQKKFEQAQRVFQTYCEKKLGGMSRTI